MLDLELPVLQAILPSNENQLDYGFNLIEQSGKRHIGILGLSFKAGTDDLRESPMVSLVERLIGKGYKISIFDRNVSLSTYCGRQQSLH